MIFRLRPASIRVFIKIKKSPIVIELIQDIALDENRPASVWKRIVRIIVLITVSFLFWSLFLSALHRSVQSGPVQIWNSFLGGLSQDYSYAVAVDSAGNVYVAGRSEGSWGAPIQAFSGGTEAFVAKLNSSGFLEWNTFLGSPGNEVGWGLAVDGSGNVYVTGYSTSNWGSPIRPYSGGYDAYVSKLNPQGIRLWNTFIGSTGNDYGHAIAVDPDGNICVAGASGSTWGSPVHPFAGGTSDGFLAKLNANGDLLLNTFLGGSGEDSVHAVAAAKDGTFCVGGYSRAGWGLPQNPFSGGVADAFVAKLSGSGDLEWNTFLGSSGADYGEAVAVAETDDIYVCGSSDSGWGSPLNPHAGGSDSFAAKLAGNGFLQWNTFIGGAGDDFSQGIALDRRGNVYVAGYGDTKWGFPVVPFAGVEDAFVADLDSLGTRRWNTFLGGTGSDGGWGLVVDNPGMLYIVGNSDAAWGSPVRPFTGGNDAFVAKIELIDALLLVTPNNWDVSSVGGTTTFDVSNTGTGTMPWTAAVTSGGSWLSIQSGSSGTDSGTIAAAFTQNTGGSSRVGTIRVTASGATGSPKDVTVTQAASGSQPTLSVTPPEGLSSSGLAGGAFSPASKDYTVQNTGGGSLSWTALKTQSWVTLSQNGGTLSAGQSTTVTVSINGSANTLTGPSYSDTVTFTNTTNGTGNTTRPVSLSVDYRQFITVRGADNWIYSRSMNTSEVMSVWTKLNGKTDVTPATAVFNGKLYMVVKSDIDTKIWWNSMTPDGTWGSWAPMDGFTTDKPSVAVFNNKLYIAVRGTDDKIYFRSMTTGEVFSSWYLVPAGLTSVPPVIHAFNNMLYLVVKDSGDDKIWWNKMNTSDAWTGWNLMDGLSPSTAAMTSFTDNQLYICVRGSDDKIYYRSMSTADTFTAWGSILGYTTTSPAIEAYNGKIYLVVKSNVDMAIWWNSMTGAGVWGNFAQMDGLMPTTASLASPIY